MVKYLALAGLSLLPTSPALEQFESEPRRPHGVLCCILRLAHMSPVASVPYDDPGQLPM